MFYFLTFPGVIIHEFAHRTFCVLSGVRVVKTVYFRFGNPSGYVIHEVPTKYLQSFIISVGPIVINSLVAVLLAYSLIFAHITSVKVLLLWLSFSIAAHAFPSEGDLGGASKEGWQALKSGSSLWPIIAFPFIALMYVAGRLGLVFRVVFALLVVVFGLIKSGLLVL